MSDIIRVFTDGASRGNPGLAGIGIVFCDDGNEILETHKKFLGKFTNNSAEYLALIESVKILRNSELNYPM